MKLELERTDSQILAAIAARETGRSKELEAAIESALEAGADVSLLQ